MKEHLDWTYDADGSFPGLPDIVNDLHNHSQKYVIIVVSCILFHLMTLKGNYVSKYVICACVPLFSGEDICEKPAAINSRLLTK